MELGKQTGSVFNHLFSRMTIAIVVSNRGLGATEYRYEADPEGSRYYFRKGKDGRWANVYINPETKRFVKNGLRGLRLGHREKYVDPSF
ncbi:MAG: hypothetical protein EB072_10255 [Betaproteobacteria bacterium]|nr:hypothetical protein [Betaproteobacteria bacterium]